MRRSAAGGFTIVELLIVIVIIAILAAIAIASYSGIQRRAVASTVQQTVVGGVKKLLMYKVHNEIYPSNFANAEYSPPPSVAVVLYTNASQTPVYSGLTSAQNAQLFINACNGFMPVVSGSTTYNTSCSYAGNNMHIAGQAGSNVVINGPSVSQSSFSLTCGSACSTAQNSIISTFLAQGGSFPIVVPSGSSTLPSPTLVSAGQASRFCVEGRSIVFSDIIYHATSEATGLAAGPCPSDPDLHYP